MRVENTGPFDAYCAFNAVPLSYGPGFRIPATTGVFTMDVHVDTHSLNCLGLSGPTSLLVSEGVQ